MVRRALPAAQPERSVHPVRTCVGCRERAPASELLRIVAIQHGADQFSLVPDPARRRPGRGAHLHPDPTCLAKAERRRAFGRALRIAGNVDTGPLTVAVEAGKRHQRDETRRTTGTADGERLERHPDTQGRTTDMSTR